MGLCKILIAESDLVVRENLLRTLTGFDCIIMLASNGKQALELIASNEFKLIITSSNLSRAHGVEIIIQTRKKDESVPIILTYENSNADVKLTDEDFMNLGATKVLKKPIKAEDFILACNEFLN